MRDAFCSGILTNALTSFWSNIYTNRDFFSLKKKKKTMEWLCNYCNSIRTKAMIIYFEIPFVSHLPLSHLQFRKMQKRTTMKTRNDLCLVFLVLFVQRLAQKYSGNLHQHITLHRPYLEAIAIFLLLLLWLSFCLISLCYLIYSLLRRRR